MPFKSLFFILLTALVPAVHADELDDAAAAIRLRREEGWDVLAQALESQLEGRLMHAEPALVLRAADHEYQAVRVAGYLAIRKRRDLEFLPFIYREAMSPDKTDRAWAIQLLYERGDRPALEYLKIMSGHTLTYSILTSNELDGWEHDLELRQMAHQRVEALQDKIRSCVDAYGQSFMSKLFSRF